MPITNNYDSLTPLERAAVAAIIPETAEGETKETVEAYLTRLGAGQSAVDSYVEAFTAQGTAQFSELGREMFLAMVTDTAKKAQLEPLIEQAKTILGLA